LNLVESSTSLGALRAVELCLFHRLGERASLLEPVGCVSWAASASRAHAWRAALIEELLPVSVGLPPIAELTVLPEGELVDELSRVLPEREAASDGPVVAEGTGNVRNGDRDGRWLVGELVGPIYQLLLAQYYRQLEACEPASDGAVVRNLQRAVADLEVVRASGATLSDSAEPEGG
jgi:hypothetical protein